MIWPRVCVLYVGVKKMKTTELQQCRAKKSCNNKLTTSAVMRSLGIEARSGVKVALLRLISRSASYSRLPVIMGSLSLHRDVRDN